MDETRGPAEADRAEASALGRAWARRVGGFLLPQRSGRREYCADRSPRSKRAAAAARAKTELVLRIAVALVVLPIVGGVLWHGGFWMGALCAAASAVAAWEYYRLTLVHLGAPAWTGIAAAAMMPLLPVALPGLETSAAFGLLGMLSGIVWIEYLLVGPRADVPSRVGHVLAGFLFASLGLLALVALRVAPGGLAWALAAMAGSWGNDAAAFFVGRSVGRHKLLPEVSPGKTWEGFIAGFAGGTATIVLACGLWLGLGMFDAIVLGALTGCVGPLGDLSKSMLKRTYHVKDSGRLFPGHGGMLDRIDALVFNAPVVLLYRWLVTGH